MKLAEIGQIESERVAAIRDPGLGRPEAINESAKGPEVRPARDAGAGAVLVLGVAGVERVQVQEGLDSPAPRQVCRDQGVGPEQQCLRDRFREEPTLVSIFNVASGIAAVPGTPAERQSYNDLSLDADGVLRRDLVHVTGQDEATVSFAMRVMEVATGDRSIRGSIDAGTDDDAWLAADAAFCMFENRAPLLECSRERFSIICCWLRMKLSFDSFAIWADLRSPITC